MLNCSIFSILLNEFGFKLDTFGSKKVNCRRKTALILSTHFFNKSYLLDALSRRRGAFGRAIVRDNTCRICCQCVSQRYKVFTKPNLRQKSANVRSVTYIAGNQAVYKASDWLIANVSPRHHKENSHALIG